MSEVVAMELPTRLRVLYPFHSRRFVHADGVGQHYIDEGDGSDGVLTVMVHGNPSWSWLYRNLVLAMRDHGRVVAVDHVGCGLSDRPRRYPYRLAQHIANLRSLLESLSFDRLRLVVHDWGGPIGIGALEPWFDRLERVVITNTAAFPMAVGSWRIEVSRKPLIGPFLTARLGLFPRAAVRQAVYHPLSEAEQEGYLFPYRRAADRKAIGRFVRDIPVNPRHPSWDTLAHVEGLLPQLAEKPVLLFWGGRDFCFDNRFLSEWRRRLPDARVEWYGDAGHYVLEDAGPEGIAEIRAFLEGRAVGGSAKGESGETA